ncbi:OmpA family protein [Thalassobius sp. Cn5-15]|uniref:OmpA family protein n=1 Tax=Thalassobius sp. Cn5-15 TaxID=2917763 RepID=UPI001EF38BB3|nr:OmpA family protein [Thalassobius sp. Cn5-15]MCG7493192.1 OmpA family protein [Thalassobius sp. Cn5-15]
MTFNLHSPARFLSRGLALTLCSALALSACTTNSYSSLTGEAGALVSGGDFGNATMHNTLAQNGERPFVIDLAKRFAQEVPGTVNFAFNSAQIDAEAAEVLNVQARWIRQFPEVRFTVFGHADAVGSDSYNRSLGKRRANAVVNYLVRHGVSRKRLKAVVSHGESRPLIVTESAERRNRRTVTEVSGFVQDAPLVLDGKYTQIVFRDYVASAEVPTTLTGLETGIAAAN